MRILFAALIVAHGVAHLVGFAVPWRLLTSPEMPYGTTVFGGTLEVGASGIRAVGVMWLASALAFLLVACALFVRAPWWNKALFVAAIASTLLCASGWPHARLGLLANGIIVAVTVVAPHLGWID